MYITSDSLKIWTKKCCFLEINTSACVRQVCRLEEWILLFSVVPVYVWNEDNMKRHWPCGEIKLLQQQRTYSIGRRRGNSPNAKAHKWVSLCEVNETFHREAHGRSVSSAGSSTSTNGCRSVSQNEDLNVGDWQMMSWFWDLWIRLYSTRRHTDVCS